MNAFLTCAVQEVLSRVCAIAFVGRRSSNGFVDSEDSPHRLAGHGFLTSPYREPLLQFFANHCLQWKRSAKPLDTFLSNSEGCRCLSAGEIIRIPGNAHSGTSDEEQVLSCCTASIFCFFKEKLGG